MASFFPEILADVGKLTDEQKAQLMAKLMAEMPEYEKVRDAKKENEDIIPKACPRCGTYNEENKVIKKHGKVNGKQRYKCTPRPILQFDLIKRIPTALRVCPL